MVRQVWLVLAIVVALESVPVATAGTIDGFIVDSNGNRLPNVQVIYERDAQAPGASVVTVFSGNDGSFRFPQTYPEGIVRDSNLSARGLGFAQVDRIVDVDGDSASIVFVMQRVENQAEVAPASAWLARLPDRASQSAFIMNCIDCHQVPASEVRNYAASIDDLHAGDAALARMQSWDAIVKYMNFLSAWEFGRGSGSSGAGVDADAIYSVENPGAVVDALAHNFIGRMDTIEGYDWGAPIITTQQTAIWEFEAEEPNAIREAIMLGDPARLFVADVASNRIVAVDIATGNEQDFEVPTDVLIAPHSLHRDRDGSLWVTPLFNSTVAHLNPDSGEWQTWKLETEDGRGVGIHDLSFGYEHVLLTDDVGRIWFSDIGNTAVGYFDPANGNTRIWPAPNAASRADDTALYGSAALYGLIMTSDRKEVWYSQLGNGVFGGFDIESESFIGPFVLPDPNSGPRRLTISPDDVMYLSLYGSGQLAEFDIKTREMIGIYDLPDTASAPYAATWDPVREVVWVATSNGDVIYRFDPRTKEFGVLPLPREQTFLRMIDIDPDTGVLVTAYANIVEVVNGPRMALIVDPGDGAYPRKFVPATGDRSRTDSGVAVASTLPSAEALIADAMCYACHELDSASLGPPWRAIAARHGGQKELMVDVLASKIVHGGGGNWGVVPMVPNQRVGLEQARVMARWVLDQAP